MPRPLEDLVGRYGRTHGPFTEHEVAGRLAIAEARVLGALAALETDGRVVRGEFRPTGVRREWCDAEVLRQLRRRSLATLRREVEPVEPAALARFLPAWHGIPAERRGTDAVVEALGLLAGAPIVASTLESDVLSSRVADYRASQLDELCTSGDVLWVGAGAIGSADGRVRLCFADQLPLLAPGWEVQERPQGALHDALRTVLTERGASFWTQLRAAAPGTADDELLAALWDLVWAGEVTNDSLAPLRSFTGRGGGRAVRTPGRGRPRPGRLNRLGPPAGAGRWSLVEPLLQPTPTPTEAAHAMARQLVERHGVVTREAVLAEGVVGGYASVYGVLKVLEERGQVRRGYFVSGLGAAQFALPGAVDRLRQARQSSEDSMVRGSRPGVGAGRHGPSPAVRRHAAVARITRAAGPHRCGGGGPPRRCAARLVRPTVLASRHVPARRRRPVLGGGAGRRGPPRPGPPRRAAQGGRRTAGERTARHRHHGCGDERRLHGQLSRADVLGPVILRGPALGRRAPWLTSTWRTRPPPAVTSTSTSTCNCPWRQRWMAKARRTWRGCAATKRSTPTSSSEFVRTGSPASAPLRSAVADSTVEELTFALNGLGPARVESIDPI